MWLYGNWGWLMRNFPPNSRKAFQHRDLFNLAQKMQNNIQTGWQTCCENKFMNFIWKCGRLWPRPHSRNLVLHNCGHHGCLTYRWWSLQKHRKRNHAVAILVTTPHQHQHQIFFVHTTCHCLSLLKRHLHSMPAYLKRARRKLKAPVSEKWLSKLWKIKKKWLHDFFGVFLPLLPGWTLNTLKLTPFRVMKTGQNLPPPPKTGPARKHQGWQLLSRNGPQWSTTKTGVCRLANK